MNASFPPRRCLALLILLVLLVRPALALEIGTSLAGDTPVTLEADRLTHDGATGTYSASGQVRLRQGELTVDSDEVTWNPDTGEAVARGQVRVTEPAGEMQADELRLNLQSGVGQLHRARIFLREQNFHIAGDLIEKFGEQSYRVTGGSFTTCDGERPSWKFGAGSIDVTAGRYAGAKHVVFYIKDIPVLYSPYLIYPAKTERESGFLMPRYGYSQKRGTQLSLAWYQVIDRHMDATFYLDYLSDLGIGKGVEYRYILGEEDEGTAHVYHINGIEGADDRYAFDWQHMGTLPGRVRLAADVEYVSSRDYFEDFGEVAGEYNKDQVQSVVVAARNWQKLNLTGQFKYTKDLQQDNDLTLQRLPEVNLTQVPRRLGDTPLYLGFDGTATHFWRKEGMKGERLNLRPSLAAVFQPGRAMAVIPEIGYRQRLYWTSDAGPGFEKEGDFDFSTRVSTRFYRDFQPDFRGAKKVRHSIEPELVYSYVPSDNQEQLPQFDAEDDLGPRNTLAYALTNRLIVRWEPQSGEPYLHELLYLRLSQEYDIRESRRDRLNNQDPLHPFSDLRAELILRPNRWSHLDIDARYDVNSTSDGASNRFLVFNARGTMEDGGGNALSLDYRYRQEELEYLFAEVDLAWLKPVYVNYQQRYDFAAQKTLEKVLNLEYRAQCWSVFLTLRDRLEDKEYLVAFALTGLGRIAKFGGEIGRSGAQAAD